MNGEGRQEALVAALVVSSILHVALMFWAKPKVMTHVSAVGFEKIQHRMPMNVSKAKETREPVLMDTVEDVKAKKEAPSESPGRESLAKSANLKAPAVLEKDLPAPKPISRMPAPELADALRPEIFEATPVKLDERLSPAVPVLKLDPPVKIAGESPAAPDVSAGAAEPWAPAAPGMPDTGFAAPLADLQMPAVKMIKDVSDTFVPVEEVLEKVDEKLVEREKEAVRNLIESGNAEELRKYVNVAISFHQDGGWTYFKVMMSPRSGLKTVEKDVVVVIDASGSIGKDRLNSVRDAARKLLRDATNSGDRFNLVAFRDKFNYAFKTWQECTSHSFEASDKWLGRLVPHGRTDVFATISSVLTLPRNPSRPVIALVITDGDANAGVRRNAEILQKFTALNDGLVSVYMYGVKGSANRELIDVLTHANRGEGYIFDGVLRWRAGSGIAGFAEGFRDPLLSDLRVVFASGVEAQAYPRLLKNIYRGGTLEFFGRVPSSAKEVAFSLKGLNGKDAFESFFAFPVVSPAENPSIAEAWRREHGIDLKLRKESLQ